MAAADWIDIARMDDLARLDTPLHRVDARAKAIVTLAFVAVVMSFPSHDLSALTPLLLYPVALIGLGRIPPGAIARKLLVAAPFVLFVGIFNPLLDREPAARVGPVVISGGWLSFASIMFRFVLTVGAALAMIACTGMYRLGAGLERLAVPRVFVVQMLFLHRYLFVVSDEAFRILRGVHLRGGSARSLSLRVYGSLVGQLLLRSMDRADRIYRAMVARGFDGQVRLMRQPTFRWTDAAFVAGWLGFFVAARVWNLADALGGILTGGAT